MIKAFLLNILNPKLTIFFLAFLPQFVDAQGASPGAEVLALGLVFVAIAIVSDGVYALAAGTKFDPRRLSPGAALYAQSLRLLRYIT